jgi:hypothetical protein
LHFFGEFAASWESSEGWLMALCMRYHPIQQLWGGFSMRKLMMCAALCSVALCALVTFVVADSSSFTVLSDTEGASLTGGACFAVPNGTSTCYKSYKGCKSTTGEKPISTLPGSWQADTPTNCGVLECGTVPKSKNCGT